MIRRILAALSALLLVVVVGCSSVDTDANQVALQYSGGWESKAFVKCVPKSTQSLDESSGDTFFYVPIGERTYRFSDEPGSDQPPIMVTAKDGVELKVRGSIKFTLNTDCNAYTDPDGTQWPGGKLQKLKERFDKDGIFPTSDGEGMPAAWNTFLRVYIGEVIDRSADEQALNYLTGELNASESKKAEWERKFLDVLPDRIKAGFKGEDMISVYNPVIQKPDLPDNLKAAIQEAVAAQERGRAAEAERSIGENWPGGLVAYQAYQREKAITEAIASGKVAILPVPQGSPVIVNGGTR